MQTTRPAARKWSAPQKILSLRSWEAIGTGFFNLFVFALLFVYLFPVVFMVFTAFMDSRQLLDSNSPVYPSQPVTFEYQGKSLPVYYVPVNGKMEQLAMFKPGRKVSLFLDPAHPGAAPLSWTGNWRGLKEVYEFHLTLDNFGLLEKSIHFPQMIRNTLLLALISELGVLVSSIIVAYGFARYPLPGGNLLFYLLIATLLIPEKVTLIPTYFFYMRVLGWGGTWQPLLIPFFFGNAVYIFLLRQNFKSIPRDLDDAAMLDGAGPLRILFFVILPQSWPVIITVSLLHFFYIWNETRQAALYLSTRPDLAPISFGV